jgi:prevent-host-death family protein
MRACNIKEAKARLNELVDAAVDGEQVILMRGSKHVAAIVPITEADLELVSLLTDVQAERLWRHLAQERAAGRTRTFEHAEAAVDHLAGTGRRRRRAGPRPPKDALPR